MKISAPLLLAAAASFLAQNALAQDTRFVVRYMLQTPYWRMVLVPGAAREEFAQRVVRPGVDLVDWTAFKSDPQRYLAPLVIKNEYPAANVPKLVVDLLEQYGFPIIVTWTGGIAWSKEDVAHAERIYRLYRADPQEYERTKLSADAVRDPIHPQHRAAVETARKAQSPWWTCASGEQPKSRTADEERRLQEFGRDRFTLKDPGSGRRDEVFSRRELIGRLGAPAGTRSEKIPADYQERPPKAFLIETTWSYPGFRIITHADESAPDRLSIWAAEVSDAKAPLGAGVGLGQSIDEWVPRFGRPFCGGPEVVAGVARYKLEYEWGGQQQLDVHVDASGKVVHVAWTYFIP
ncbi:MAG TPA: hypothetical protein VFB01_08590 [Burkholderiales bacterium]|nr:hypothetical protein [Burkholderiales bacterium]